MTMDDYRDCCATLRGHNHSTTCARRGVLDSLPPTIQEEISARMSGVTDAIPPPPKRPKPLAIFVPPELEALRPDLQRFIDAMIFKLRANAHKGRWADLDVKDCLPKLKDEVFELTVAIKEGSSSEILMEAADVANWSLITANVALEAKNV